MNHAPRDSDRSAILPPGALAGRILYRDALMLVVDKPAGIPVHPGSGGGLTLQDRLDELRFGLPLRPALAHRLDRETSGCLVLGRNRAGLQELGRFFAEGRVEKTYWALVEGGPPEAEGLIDLPLAKAEERSWAWRMRPSPDGQPARTRYRVLARGPDRAWVALYPETGRTHQLRVHLAALGCPILGDWIYGHGRPPSQRHGSSLMLHARAVSLPLYARKPPVTAAAPPPAPMADLLAGLTGRDGVPLAETAP